MPSLLFPCTGFGLSTVNPSWHLVFCDANFALFVGTQNALEFISCSSTNTFPRSGHGIRAPPTPGRIIVFPHCFPARFAAFTCVRPSVVLQNIPTNKTTRRRPPDGVFFSCRPAARYPCEMLSCLYAHTEPRRAHVFPKSARKTHPRKHAISSAWYYYVY